MQREISPKIVALTFGILAISFLAAFYVVAWQEPSQAPPGGNVPTPLNVGPTGQSKSGGLILNTGGALYGLIVDKGKSKFGGNLEIEVIPAGTTGSYSLNWDGLQVCQFGTCCPSWRDCDGDGKTYQAGTDCDEGCATCYVGSNLSTFKPDGKDQNCDGRVDELELWYVIVSCSDYPYPQSGLACDARCKATQVAYTGKYILGRQFELCLSVGEITGTWHCDGLLGEGDKWWKGRESTPACGFGIVKVYSYCQCENHAYR